MTLVVVRMEERLARLDEWALTLGHRRVVRDRKPAPKWARWWLFGTVGATAAVVGGVVRGQSPDLLLVDAAIWLGLGLPLGWVMWGPRR